MDASDSRVSKECAENSTVGSEAEPTNVSCTEIIVVRHGETEWNALGKMQGQTDIDLNEVGRQQAVTVAGRLSRESNITAIYTSDLKRALETAETIASKCGGLEVVIDKDLRERHIGELQGLTYHESPKVNPKAFEALKSRAPADQKIPVMRDQDLRERHLGALQGHAYQEIAKLNPKAYEAFKSHRLDQEIPGGGESRDQLYRRCTSSLKRIGEKHRGQRIIVVSHGGVIRSLFIRGAARGQHPGRISNTSVGILQLSDGDMWSIKSWNDISHLRQTGYLGSAFGGDASSG